MCGASDRNMVKTTSTPHVSVLISDSLSVLLAWIVAAIFVSIFHQVGSFPSSARFIASLAAIFVVAFFHARGAFPRNHVHPLVVGAVWLALSIGFELIIGSIRGVEWDGLLGPPREGFYRTMMLIAWAISPLLFARRLPHQRQWPET